MNDKLEKEFEAKFGHIAHKGVQCDTQTLTNIINWISTVYTPALLRELREKIEEMKKGDYKKITEEDFSGNYDDAHELGYYKAISRVLSLLKESDRV